MILVTSHPTELKSTPHLRDISLNDWRKITHILSGRWPKETPPHVCVLDSPTPLTQWLDKATYSRYVTIDTEPSGNRPPKLIALGAPDIKVGLVIFWESLTPGQQLTVAECLYWIAAVKCVVMHNAPADIVCIESAIGLTPPWYWVDDSMAAHAALFPRHPHSLVHCQSVYGQYPLTKGSKVPGLHPWGDVLATMDTWEGLRRQCSGWEGWERYGRHMRTSLWTIVDEWRAGRETNLGTIVDPTWRK